MQLHLTSIDTSSISFFVHIEIERNMENNHSNALIGRYGPSGIRATIDLCIKIHFFLIFWKLMIMLQMMLVPITKHEIFRFM